MKYTVLDYLEATAQSFPDKIAFADVKTSVTWNELVQQSKAYSTVIAAHYAPGTAVPVMIEKSVETVIWFFAVLYAGCFYSYIDATFPDSRLNSMLETLGTKTVLAQERYAKKLTALGCTPVFTTQAATASESQPDADRRLAVIDTDPVYANFTSGSTGTPKAVVVSHHSVIDFITCFTELFGITNEDVFANQAPFDFDVSVKDIFSAVFTGATVHLVPKMFFSFPTKLLDFLEERQITTLVWAVSALCLVTTFDGFSYKVPSKIRKVMFSGEVMPPRHLKIWQEHYPQAEFINLYGPTEITCNCTYYRIKGTVEEGTDIPMGIPFPNERVFLLDEDDHLVSQPDAVGEVCVSGTCVAIGYYSNGERTQSVFTQNPLETRRYERIYRTGDLATLGSDGLFYYRGRKDTQIKHMGHRIELSEIEGAMMTLEGVKRACCVFVNAKIESFYVADAELTKKDFSAALKKTLPEYMVPTSFTRLESLPLNKNGKIDRHALEALAEEETHA